MPGKGKRRQIPLSFSPSNPDAVAVMQALVDQEVPEGQRSATIWRWAALYLAGAMRQDAGPTVETIDDAALDALLDAF